MCGRIELSEPTEKLVTRFAIDQVLFEPDASYNIAPSQTLTAVVVAENNVRRLQPLQWGFIPSWAREIKARPINARAEGIAGSALFKGALKYKRCLICAQGFYEWKLEGKRKQPYHIGLPNHEVFAFAGLWSEWEHGDHLLHTGTIITTSANESMQGLHERMPVILPRDYESIWLEPDNRDTDELLSLLQPYDGDLEIYPVSLAVNAPKNNFPELLNAI